MSVRPAKTQIDLAIRPVWSESSLCTQWVAEDPSSLHADSKDSDQNWRMPRLIWVFAGRTTTLLVLLCRGSFVGQWLIFHGPVISPRILKTIWWMRVTLDIMYQCDTKIHQIIYIYRSVTYISWSSNFDLYLEKTIWRINVILWIMDQCDTKIDLIKICWSVTYISWSSEFA